MEEVVYATLLVSVVTVGVVMGNVLLIVACSGAGDGDALLVSGGFGVEDLEEFFSPPPRSRGCR